MSDNLIRCIHENGKVCFLTKKDTENRNFMKKYGIRVEHVEKKEPVPIVNIPVSEEIKHIDVPETNREAEAEAIDKQVAEALAEAKPKATRTRSTKPKKPTKK